MVAGIRRFVDQEIERGEPGRSAWFYCDSLYVAPPTLAMLGRATKERKYFEYLHRMYWDVVGHLYDEDAGLFYRDKDYFHATSGNGRKVFWSRGNGWVIAGIPRILEYLPKDDAYRSRYLQLFRRMASSISAAQGPDGLWRTNLADPDDYPDPETSGTAFFCYALGWGVNTGVLDKDVYAPVVYRAWEALVRNVDSDGELFYAQKPHKAPVSVPKRWKYTYEYALGALLLAGSEVAALVPKLAR